MPTCIASCQLDVNVDEGECWTVHIIRPNTDLTMFTRQITTGKPTINNNNLLSYNEVKHICYPLYFAYAEIGKDMHSTPAPNCIHYLISLSYALPYAYQFLHINIALNYT